MTMRIEGIVCTPHADSESVAEALSPDNLLNMKTTASGGFVRTEIHTGRLRSLVASVDDYLMNLAIAEDICYYVSLADTELILNNGSSPEAGGVIDGVSADASLDVSDNYFEKQGEHSRSPDNT
ncbi:KEOPS complex subunit Pcc1 [Methanogenium sp. MK-MG]|uniref:KEOPS complex subunit Pcc1 n=1 Tax=Methanogenium sp. MK-MG TaxID=2599926 RepID=UPI001C20B889|nr:KEOPS complex subunit Pcc1 [Methanogenium sp. MK-MG]KAF1074940.1 hypothetical protein MKMG_01840 [Methanogenium sp. MK-MG]